MLALNDFIKRVMQESVQNEQKPEIRPDRNRFLTFVKFLFIYFLVFFLPILSLTYLELKAFFLFYQPPLVLSTITILLIFAAYFFFALIAVIITHKIMSTVIIKFLLPSSSQPVFLKLAKILSVITILFFTFAPPTTLVTLRFVENFAQELNQKEAGKYLGDVELSNFNSLFEPASSSANQYKRLVIRAQVETKKAANYTFRVSLYCPALINPEYTLWVNESRVWQKDEATKKDQQAVSLPQGQSSLTLAYEFIKLSFNPIYQTIECTFNYQIVRLDRKKKSGILSQLGIKPEYINNWEFPISTYFDGENWKLPLLTERDFYQWNIPLTR